MENSNSLLKLKKKTKYIPNIQKGKSNYISYNLAKSKDNEHTKYHQLYKLNQNSEESKTKNEKKNEIIKIKLKDKKKYEMLQKLFKKPPPKQKTYLTKLTKPKLPFSLRKKESPEIRKKRLNSMWPSLKYHDFYTIRWLRQKYSNSILEKSINTLLPDNGKPVIPDDESEKEKKHRKLLEFLEATKPVIEREKNVNIDPKYFFDKKTFEKILKLKEIFLEFDEDGSRKMEIDEMFTMFNQNNISADINELVKLFFNDDKSKSKNIMNLYLDFFQFMQFALKDEQKFLNFMRDIKKKYKKKNKKNEKDENVYLPMNFNLVLDYFITKGKERSALEIIKKSMDDMDEVLNKGLSKDKNLANLNLSILRTQIKKKSIDNQDKRVANRLSCIKNAKTRFSICNFSNVRGINLNDEESSSDEIEKAKDLEHLEKINFKEPIKEFENLFKAHGLSFSKKNSNKMNVNSINKSFEKKFNNIYSKQSSYLSDNSTTFRKTQATMPNRKKLANKYIEDSIIGNVSNCIESRNIESSENSIIADTINNYINKKMIRQMNMTNYDKFHNIKIAIDKSNKEIDRIKRFNEKETKNSFQKTDINYSKDNSINGSFFKLKKLENVDNINYFQKNNLFNFYEKKLNPYFMNSSYFRKGSRADKKIINNSLDRSNNLTNNYFNTFSEKQNSLINKRAKIPKKYALDESIRKTSNKYDYVPFELLNQP